MRAGLVQSTISMGLWSEVSLDRYLVLGNPVEHSLSPLIHGLFAEQTETAISYDKRLVAIDSFSEELIGLVDQGYRGFNVTVPFKLDAFDLVSDRDQNASEAGAVNTIKVKPGGELEGCNTDGIGLSRDLTTRLRIPVAGKKILILGAGGAARGIIGPLIRLNPNSLTLANRTIKKAEVLSNYFQKSNDSVRINWVKLDEVGRSYDLIINASAIGLYGDSQLISDQAVRNKVCYDLSYGANAKFARWAEQASAAMVSDGLGMLVEQAAESFYIWRGKRPMTDEVYHFLREKVDGI